SGLVWASNTSWRGASKTRVITTSRSPGVVSFNVPALFIGHLLVLAVWFLAHRAARRGAGSSPPTAGGSPPAISWLRRVAWARGDGDAAVRPGRAKPGRRAPAPSDASRSPAGSSRTAPPP